MANPKHLDLLERGIEIWNQWRTEHPKIHPDLSRTDLRDYNLRGANLSGANLMGCYLHRVNLEGAILNNTHLTGADLSGAKLGAVDLSEANLSLAHLMGADLREANLTRANLDRTDLNRANFTRAHLGEAILTQANAIGSYFSGANLMGADLSEVSSSEANFIGANLVGANLTRINLSGAYLSGANLSGANLTRANFCGTNLIGANLSKVQVLDTNFSEAILTGACIEDWCVRSSIVLQGVTCDYAYQRSYYDRGTLQFRDRLPHDTTRNLAPGEFASFIQQAIETVELSFDRGIEWEAFFRAFHVLQEQMRAERDGVEIAIQAMEKKLDGTFAIHVEVPTATEGTIVSDLFRTLYDRALPVIQEQALHQSSETLENQGDRCNFMEFIRFFSSNVNSSNFNASNLNQSPGDRVDNSLFSNISQTPLPDPSTNPPQNQSQNLNSIEKITEDDRFLTLDITDSILDLDIMD
ncbi:MAG: pentapeptide repeat-containing protein [Cyanobacteriota bacterium]|nr:pentapeptide repeat-containing protein [Cyanobacteriota bacterium]